MNITRRKLAAVAGMLPIGALVGCGTQTPSQVAQNVALFADSFKGSLPSFAMVSGITTSVVAAIGQAVADMSSAAAAFATADASATAVVTTSQTAQQLLVSRIESDFNAVIAAIAAFPVLPPQIKVLIDSAQILLPVIELGVNMLVNTAAASPEALSGAKRNLRLAAMGQL